MRASGADEATISAEREACKLRQRAWVLMRKRKPAAGGHWKPRERHRKAAYMYAIAVNNQIEQCTGKSLLHFRQAELMNERGHWSTWPLVSASPDLGSDELAAHILSEQTPPKL